MITIHAESQISTYGEGWEWAGTVADLAADFELVPDP